MLRIYNKIILIHPGTQHIFRLANALSIFQNGRKVKLYTWFLLPQASRLSTIAFFKKRVKNISKQVSVHNFPLFELLLTLHLKTNQVLSIKNGHTTRYKWQVLFGYFMLPLLYFNRKNSILILSETCAWPLSRYAKRWNIPVIIDFPSISHEAAEKAGISETEYGKKIKTLERQFIDYGINCSNFSRKTYSGLTSAKKHYAIWLGANRKSELEIQTDAKSSHLHICCLANTEKRKGLDILLKVFNTINHSNKKLFLIGKINKDWISSFCKEHKIEESKIYLTGAMAQQDLADFLLKEGINLHILPSRFDSFGMVVPETMSLGIPNIVSPYVGAGEMLDDETDGFIMKSLNVESLSFCIQKYIDLSPEEKNMLIQKVLEKSKQMTWDKYNERVHIVFNKILADMA